MSKFDFFISWGQIIAGIIVLLVFGFVLDWWAAGVILAVVLVFHGLGELNQSPSKEKDSKETKEDR